MYQSIYHANCASLVVIKSLSLKKLTNFKMGKLANYFWHLIFVHPVIHEKMAWLGLVTQQHVLKEMPTKRIISV